MTASGISSAPRAAKRRRERRLRAGCQPGYRPARPRQAPQAAALPVGIPAGNEETCGCPALCGPPAPSQSVVNGGAFYVVCCCLSCVWLWSCLVVCLPVWRCLWLVACSVCSVSLAVRSGGGVGLSAGGGFCPRLLLACWCSCWSAGCCPLQVAPRSGCSVAADPGRFGPDRRQLPPQIPQKRKIPLR